jgi:hypothetical protein
MDLTELQKGASIASMIQAAFSVVIGIATVSVLMSSLRLNKRSQELASDLHKSSQALAKQSKQTDVLGDFNARYSRIWEMRASDDIIAKPIVFYERFWSLQLDQFDAWCRGFVPRENFIFWVDSRYDDWVADKSFGQMSYRKGFEETVGTWKQSAFVTFIKTLHNAGSSAAIAEASKAGFPRA